MRLLLFLEGCGWESNFLVSSPWQQVPDYYDIVQCPMDLGTVMKKIDEHQYMTPKQWVEDIDLIARNALE